MPEKKVTAAAVAGAVVTIAVWILGMFGIDVPPAVAAAITTLLGAAAGWLAPHTFRTAPQPRSTSGSARP